VCCLITPKNALRILTLAGLRSAWALGGREVSSRPPPQGLLVPRGFRLTEARTRESGLRHSRCASCEKLMLNLRWCVRKTFGLRNSALRRTGSRSSQDPSRVTRLRASRGGLLGATLRSPTLVLNAGCLAYGPRIKALFHQCVGSLCGLHCDVYWDCLAQSWCIMRCSVGCSHEA